MIAPSINWRLMRTSVQVSQMRSSKHLESACKLFEQHRMNGSSTNCGHFGSNDSKENENINIRCASMTNGG